MTVYVTPYDGETTGLSVDSGFGSISDVVAAMGPPDISRLRYVAYGEAFFSDFPFNIGTRGIDDYGITGYAPRKQETTPS